MNFKNIRIVYRTVFVHTHPGRPRESSDMRPRFSASSSEFRISANIASTSDVNSATTSCTIGGTIERNGSEINH